MSGNRCLNDVFTYCTGEPKRCTKEVETVVVPSTKNKNTGRRLDTIPYCELNQSNCRKNKTL